MVDKLVSCPDGHRMCCRCSNQHEIHSPGEHPSASFKLQCTGSTCLLIKVVNVARPLCPSIVHQVQDDDVGGATSVTASFSSVVSRSLVQDVCQDGVTLALSSTGVETAVVPRSQEQGVCDGVTSRKRKADDYSTEPPSKRVYSTSTGRLPTTGGDVTRSEVSETSKMTTANIETWQFSYVTQSQVPEISDVTTVNDSDKGRQISGFGSAIAGKNYRGVYCKISIESNVSIGISDDDDDDENDSYGSYTESSVDDDSEATNEEGNGDKG